MKKIRYFFAIITTIILALPASYASALELTYPNLGVRILPGTDLVGYIRYYFVFGVLASGIVGIASIVLSGLQILLSAGNPSKLGPAKERIIGAVFGIILLLCCIILLQTINPSLVTQVNFIQPPAGGGLYLVRPPPLPFNNSKSKLADLLIPSASAQLDEPFDFPLTGDDQSNASSLSPAPEDNPSLSDEFGEGYVTLVHDCVPGSEPDYLINTYVTDEFGVNSQATTITLPCSTDLTQGMILQGKASYQARLKNPGLLYFNSTDCTGLTTFYDKDYAAQTVDGNIPFFQDPEDPAISPTLDQTVHSIGFVTANLTGYYDEPQEDFYWGAILNRFKNGAGECSIPIINNTSGFLCVEIGSSAWPQTIAEDGQPLYPIYVHIIKTDKDPNNDPSKQGVTFWSANKHFTLNQVDPDPIKNIGTMWHYDKNNASLIDVSSQNDGSLMRQGKGNPDELLRKYGLRANNNFRPIPGDECIPYDPDDPTNRDSTLGRPASPPPTGSRSEDPIATGYLHCINMITEADESAYEIPAYTFNKDTGARACFIVGGEGAEFYNDRVWPPASNIPEQLNREQIIEKIYIYPVFNGSVLYRQ